MKGKGGILKAISLSMFIIAVILVVIATMVATGGGSGFLDLSGFVALVILGIALVFGILSGVAWVAYKRKNK